MSWVDEKKDKVKEKVIHKLDKSTTCETQML